MNSHHRLFLGAVFLCLDAHAQSWGPIAAGMGCSGTTLGGTWSTFQNPAGLQVSRESEIAARQINRFRIGNWTDGALAFSTAVTENLRFGCILSQEGFSGFQTTTAGMGIGLRTGRNWTSGISVGWKHDRINSGETSVNHSIRTALGTMMAIGQRSRVALVMDDLQYALGYHDENRLYPSFRSGYTMEFSNSFDATVEVSMNPEATGFNTGASYRPTPDVAIRIGYSTETGNISGGIGIKWKKWSIDSAVRHHPFLGISSTIGLSFDYAKEVE